MKILISLFFSISLAFSVFAEDIKIIELHNQTIDQILLNATSGGDGVNNDTNDDVNIDTKDDVNKAYVKIQKKIHPDVSPETSRLSSIVNEAKDIVLNDIS